MNLFSKKNIKGLFRKYQTKPLKGLGQNFLIDKGIVKKVIKSANLTPSDTILEIGPGIGTLTQELTKKTRKIIAIEKDLKMIEILKETMKNFQNVKIIQGDILKISNFPARLRLRASSLADGQFPISNYKVVANLPFYLTAPVIRQFLELPKVYGGRASVNFTGPSSASFTALLQPQEMILIVQKEVAQRICAKPGKMSILAVSVQLYAQPKIISYISKKSFWPQPKVDSAIIKIVPHRAAPLLFKKGGGLREQFFKIVRSGFSQPRKQLVNNLSKGLKIDKIKIEQWLLKNNIQPSQRAETLTIKDWLKLVKNFKIRV